MQCNSLSTLLGRPVHQHVIASALSDFDHGMVVGARQGCLNISETADHLGFSFTTVSLK